MKKIIVIVLVLIVFGSIAYFVANNNIIHKNSYDFEYNSGYLFWEKSIGSVPNTTFQKVVEFGYIQPCTSDTVISNGQTRECRKGPGLLGAVNLSGIPLQVFLMPENQGFYTRDMKDLNAYPKSYYYPGSSSQENFFLIQFENYYVPSYYVASSTLLSSWKNEMIKSLQISEKEFNKKFRVVGISYGGQNEFRVQSYYHDDWAQLPVISNSYINWKDPVLSKERITTILDNYDYPLTFDVNDLRFHSVTGNIIMRLRGVISKTRNECLKGSLDLVTGKIETSTGACSVN